MGMYNYFPDKEIKSQCQRQGSAHILQYYIYYNATYYNNLQASSFCQLMQLKSPLVHAIMAPNRSAQSYKQECREETF